MDDAREEWDALAPASRNIFATFEWNSAWWRHFGRGRALRLAVGRTGDGSARAILPLYLSRTGPARILRFLGHGPGDELGPVCAPADRETAGLALRGALDSGGWDVFLGDELAGDVRWAEVLGGRVVHRTSSPVLRFDGSTWDEFLATRSQNLRQQVRRFERRLASGRDLRFRLGDESGSLPADLDTLFALHAARWPGSPWFARAEAFHREFAAVALERGWLRLWLLEIDGGPVAAWLGYRFAGVESYYQAGRDPAWEPASVGFVLLAHTIREALADGMDEYRFLRGGEAFKYRFANADPGVVTVARSGSPLGAAALAFRAVSRRLRRADDSAEPP